MPNGSANPSESQEDTLLSHLRGLSQVKLEPDIADKTHQELWPNVIVIQTKLDITVFQMINYGGSVNGLIT